jgi:phosphoribosylanthranilate isomerase
MTRFWENKEFVRIKICGVESLEYAYDIYDLGVDAIGYHLWKHEINTVEQRRKINIFNLLSSYLPTDLSKFLLTNVTDLSVLTKIVSSIKFDTLQFHDYLPFFHLRNIFESIRKVNPLLKLVSVISLNPNEFSGDIIELAKEYSTISDAILVDSSWTGGSGEENNWILAKQINDKIQGKLILAGGVKFANIKRACSIVRPFAIDIQSSVERVVDINNHRIKIKSVNYTKRLLDALDIREQQ